MSYPKFKKKKETTQDVAVTKENGHSNDTDDQHDKKHGHKNGDHEKDGHKHENNGHKHKGDHSKNGHNSSDHEKKHRNGHNKEDHEIKVNRFNIYLSAYFISTIKKLHLIYFTK